MVAVFLIATIVLVGFTVLLGWFGQNDFEWYNVASAIMSFVTGVTAVIGLIVCLVFAWGWKSAGYQAKIINREYGTSYSTSEVFYARGVIDTIRQLERYRISAQVDMNTTKGED